jgi:hypothetical protein
MISKKILKDLEEIIEQGLSDIDLPYVAGKSIRIKNCVIRKTKHNDYIVLDVKENKSVAKTNFKYTAIALAKRYLKNYNLEPILDLDKELLKHYNDAVFYKNAIRSSQDSHYAATRQNRLDISLHNTIVIQKKLDAYIFN